MMHMNQQLLPRCGILFLVMAVGLCQTDLQTLLDEHRYIRLAPGDYTPVCNDIRFRNGTTLHNCSFPDVNITVRSGYHIWGLPTTRIPGIIVEPGSTNILLHQLSSNLLLFPDTLGAEAETSYNTFTRLSELHIRFEQGCNVSNCLFLGITNVKPGGVLLPAAQQHTVAFPTGGIHAEADSSVLNCKFIRLMVHGPWPLLTVESYKWRGNAIVWANVLGSLQASFGVTDAPDFTVVGADIETYGACWVRPAIQASNVASTKLYGIHGRLQCHPQPNISVPIPTPIFDLDTEALLISNSMSDALYREYNGLNPIEPNADLVVGRQTKAMLWIDRGSDPMWITDGLSKTNGLALQVEANSSVLIAGKAATGLSTAQQHMFDRIVGLPAASNRTPWAIPAEPDPLPPLPPLDPKSGKDSSAYLQQMIDSFVTSSSPSIVPAGVYYIATTLRVGRLPDPNGNATACRSRQQWRHLVGSGTDKVIIVAKDPSMTMVTSDGCGLDAASETARFHVMGVTLVGGAVGFHFKAATGHLQITDSTISHVRFRNLNKYGIWLDDIFGFDNNLMSDLWFDNCGVAFFQRAPDSQRIHPGGPCKQPFNNPYIGYMDKIVFHSVTVSNCGEGFHLEACRADNLNYFTENVVVNITGNSWYLFGTSETAIVSSFVKNTGTFNAASAVTKSDGNSPVDILNSKFIAGTGTAYLLPRRAKIDGSSFERATDVAPNASLFPRAASGNFEELPSVLMSHSTVKQGFSLRDTAFRTSLLINNRLLNRSDSLLNVMGAVLNGTHTFVISSSNSDTSPCSSYCVGPSW